MAGKVVQWREKLFNGGKSHSRAGKVVQHGGEFVQRREKSLNGAKVVQWLEKCFVKYFKY
jgi:hypothetical protein